MTRAASRAWRIALLLGAAVQPWCEAGALEHAQRRLATRGTIGFDAWDLDLHGLQLRGVTAELRGRALAAESITVGLAHDGVQVDVAGLVAWPLAPRDAARDGPAQKPAIRDGPGSRGIDTHGLAVHVRTAGTLTVALPDGGAITLADPAVDLDGGGGVELRAHTRIDAPSLPRLGSITAELPDLVVRRERDHWRVVGTVAIDGGPPLAVELERPDRGSARAWLTDAAGGTLALVADGTTDALLRADRFAPASLGTAVLAQARARGLGLETARISGALALVREEWMRVHVDGLLVEGLQIDDRRLAARPVRLDGLGLDGDVSFAGADRFDAQVVVAHRGAQVAVAAARDGDALRIELELAELGCTELLQALPAGMADLLQGARLDGSIDGRLVLAVSLGELARARANSDLDPDAPAPAPGVLEVDFDVLGRCRTLAPPASVDLEGLRGPWRHRFVGTDGRMHERVLAAGAPGFAPLVRVRRIASAFIALEDMRFWDHDGFDREQIERAFWHNVEHGRVRRGASTISQQTARNLWLGVDRSLARKLQEAWLTAELEAGVSKERILELYVNLIELGPGIYGVDAGARHHFGLPPEQLSVLQAIHLAALAPAPRTLSERFASGEVDDAWLAELRDHARRMNRNGMITDEDLFTALSGELELTKH